MRQGPVDRLGASHGRDAPAPHATMPELMENTSPAPQASYSAGQRVFGEADMIGEILGAANRIDQLLRLHLGRLYHVILAAGCVIELIHRLREGHTFLHPSGGGLLRLVFPVILYVVLVVNQASALYAHYQRRRQGPTPT